MSCFVGMIIQVMHGLKDGHHPLKQKDDALFVCALQKDDALFV